MPHSTQRLRFGGSLADIVRSTDLLTYLLRVMAGVHPVHATSVQQPQRQMVADVWTKPIDLSHNPACRRIGYYIHNRQFAIYHYSARKLILILLSHGG